MARNNRQTSGTRPRDPDRPRPLLDTILSQIWKEQQVSRADLARLTDHSRSTISEAVGELLSTGLVAEVGAGPSRGGRRPIVLQFQDDACAILGVEMGARHVGVALTNLRGHVLSWRERDHPVRKDPEGTRAVIQELCGAALKEWGQGKEHLVGIGIAVPSPVDPEGNLSELVMPEWSGETGFAALESAFGVPVLIDNDANLGAVAEHWWGAAHGCDDFAYIKISTGVGAGHYIRGQIYRGATGVAGEIGHMAVDPSGDQCICGLHGCLATKVGAGALVDRARELLTEHPTSSLADIEITITDIEDAAIAGDDLALALVKEAAEFLGISIAGLLNLTNPSMVVVGGSLSRVGELLLAPLRETVRQRTLVSSVAASDIWTSKLGPRAIAVGAATLVLKSALEDSRKFPVAIRGLEAK